MDKQLSVLYFSATDSTAKVIKEIAASISDSFKEYNITLPINRQKEVAFGSNDLVIVGLPVYAGRVPAFLMDYLVKVKGNDTPAIFITVYGNRNYDDALLELKDTFEKNGFIGIAGGAFIAEHSYTDKVGTGRPDADDLKIAREFGAEIRNKLESNEDVLQLSKLIVKGNFPYKERIPAAPMSPETKDNCINCGICAKHCPMGAIDFNDYKKAEASKCVKCCSCIRRCPLKAKSINHEIFKKFTQGLIDNFSTVRHEPELFI